MLGRRGLKLHRYTPVTGIMQQLQVGIAARARVCVCVVVGEGSWAHGDSSNMLQVLPDVRVGCESGSRTPHQSQASGTTCRLHCSASVCVGGGGVGEEGM